MPDLSAEIENDLPDYPPLPPSREPYVPELDELELGESRRCGRHAHLSRR